MNDAVWTAGAFLFIFAAVILYLGRRARLREDQRAREFRKHLDQYHDEDMHQ
jgi:hypothetical protein